MKIPLSYAKTPVFASDHQSSKGELAAVAKRLSSRDLQLWSIGFLVMVVLVAGVLTAIMPNLLREPARLNVELRYLPQLLFGLIALVLLVNFYLFEQRRDLRQSQNALSREMALTEMMEKFLWLDPLTETFDRKYLEHILAREASTANRFGTSTAFAMIEMTGGRGSKIAGNTVSEIARVIRSNFRGSDTIIRFSEVSFLVILPGTTAKEATRALTRLFEKIDKWNVSSNGSEVVLFCGVSSCPPGEIGADVIAEAQSAIEDAKASGTTMIPAVSETWVQAHQLSTTTA